MKDQPVPGIPGALMRRVQDVPPPIPADALSPRIHARRGLLHFDVPGTGRYLAREGNLIEFAQEEQADPRSVELFLHGTPRGALIHMRGELALHAVTLVPPGENCAIAICGASGAGKSTLGFELSRRGWLLLADDVTRVTWSNGAAIAWPSRDRIKLWRDAYETAGLVRSDTAKVSADLDKYYVTVPAKDKPMPLKTIFELTTGKAGECLSFGNKMALIARQTYRRNLIVPLSVGKQYIKIVSRISAALHANQIIGRNLRSPGMLADFLEKKL